MRIFKRNIYIFTAFFLGAAIIVLFGFKIALSFTEPSSTPPNNNVPAPLDTSNVGQLKQGGLMVGANCIPPALCGAGSFLVPYGNAGIGTMNPNTKLNVFDESATAGEHLISTFGKSDGSVTIGYINDGSGTETAGLIRARHSVNLVLGTSINTTNALVINGTTGNVGIGTTNPGANLDVKGVGDTAGQISLQLLSGNSSTNFNSNQIAFGYAGGANYRHALKTRHNSGAASGNAYDFYTWQPGDAVGAVGSLFNMTINGGTVGIGTINPDTSSKLEVAGQVKITGGTPGNGKVLTSDANGLASWQTPSSGLGGSGTANKLAKFTAGNTVGDSQITDNGSGSGVGIIGAPATGVMLNITGDTVDSILRLTRTGGTNSTTFRLGTDDVLVVNNSGSDTLTLKGGNVGIGTTNPGATLEVNGRILSSANIGSQFYSVGARRSNGSTGFPDVYAVNASNKLVLAGADDGTGDVVISNNLVISSNLCIGGVCKNAWPTGTAYTAGTGLNLTGTVFSIADGGVGTAQLADGAVTSPKIALNTIQTSNIADSAITSVKIADNQIVDADINNNAAIVGTKILPNFGGLNVVTTGNAGIGTTNPGARLEVDADVPSRQKGLIVAGGIDNGYLVEFTNAIINNSNLAGAAGAASAG